MKSLCVLAVTLFILSCFVFPGDSISSCLPANRIFNVNKYGAIASGNIDNSRAFLRAWNDACNHGGRVRVFIPPGTYGLGAVVFQGPCKGEVAFVIKGTLKAPSDRRYFFTDTWIAFRYVEELTVKGSGYLDGQGSSAWPYNDCSTNPQCSKLPASLRLDFVKNSRIHHIRSINSKSIHFNLFACNNVNISKVRLSAPGDSPNTDGIHIGSSSHISIFRAVIQTGDDCISMVSGSRDIDIHDVVCGPGHGISIGSLGKSHNSEYVSGVKVRNVTFNGSDNGLRIKTWSPSPYGMASDLTFKDIFMVNTRNPIIIDQMYCPYKHCDGKGISSSGVQIKDVTFENVRGTSSSQVAVNIQCSAALPCKNVKLIDINLAYKGPGGPATAVCSYVKGDSYGRQKPGGCL